MRLNRLNIENYRCFKGKFSLTLNDGINILVGNNEAGKSTILEAINLVLTGIINGRYLRYELSQYLFNHDIINEYLDEISKGNTNHPPHICIEAFLKKDDYPLFEGNDNSDRERACGVSLKIEFDESYKGEYQELLSSGEINTIPIEYYKVTWKSFARESVTSRSIPLKSVLIDSSSNRYQNGSDVYISRIIKNDLEDKEKAEISQVYRKMKESFMDSDTIKNINKKVKSKSNISNKDLHISVDLSAKNSWETTLMTYLDETPFHQIGKGEQCIIKTNLALGHKKSQDANLILLEEPENHLSHTKLNELIKRISDNCRDKQVIISTHSSFVANKLGLENLILLHNKNVTKLSELTHETYKFFQKLAGYQTLRLFLCRKAVLVEGDSDELVFQKAYMLANNGKLPIEDGVDVISVGISFKRFLEIAEKVKQPVAILTDNDGDIDALEKKYKNYLGKNSKDDIEIFYDPALDSGDLKVGKSQSAFNYNTLEPKFLKKIGLKKMNAVLGQAFKTDNECHIHMRANKTDSALKIFNYNEPLEFPDYIEKSVEWCNDE